MKLNGPNGLIMLLFGLALVCSVLVFHFPRRTTVQPQLNVSVIHASDQVMELSHEVTVLSSQARKRLVPADPVALEGIEAAEQINLFQMRRYRQRGRDSLDRSSDFTGPSVGTLLETR